MLLRALVFHGAVPPFFSFFPEEVHESHNAEKNASHLDAMRIDDSVKPIDARPGLEGSDVPMKETVEEDVAVGSEGGCREGSKPGGLGSDGE